MSDKNQRPPASDAEAQEREMTLEQGKLGDRGLQQVHAQLMREKEEPTEGFSPVPIYLLFIFCALTFWAGIYLERYSGHFKWYAYTTEFEDPSDSPPAPVDKTSPDWLLPRGERLFTANCATCHQATGQGAPGVYPPLVESKWVTGSQERLIAILLHGLVGPIEVRGNTYNGNMPAFGAHPSFRTDDDLAAVMSYVRQSWGNQGDLIVGDKVTEVRDQLGSRGPWTADELTANWPMEE